MTYTKILDFADRVCANAGAHKNFYMRVMGKVVRKNSKLFHFASHGSEVAALKLMRQQLIEWHMEMPASEGPQTINLIRSTGETITVTGEQDHVRGILVAIIYGAVEEERLRQIRLGHADPLSL